MPQHFGLICTLSSVICHTGMSDTLSHKAGEEGGVWGGRGVGGSFLIEFSDNTEINLTPLKFDYSSAAVLSHPSCCGLYVSFLFFPPISLPFVLSLPFLLWLTNTIDPDHFELRALWSIDFLNYICAHIGTVHRLLSWARWRILPFILFGRVQAMLSFLFFFCFLGGGSTFLRPANACRRMPRVNSWN